MAPWTETAKELPPEGVLVETKIDDGAGGYRNVSELRRRGRLWLVPSGDMYVYYTPTHWRPKAAQKPLAPSNGQNAD